LFGIKNTENRDLHARHERFPVEKNILGQSGRSAGHRDRMLFATSPPSSEGGRDKAIRPAFSRADFGFSGKVRHRQWWKW
jgi:hypothetical protein